MTRIPQPKVQMNLLQDPVRAKVTSPSLPLPSSPIAIEPGLGKILDRGVLRVCYIRDSLPYPFVNTSGQLANFLSAWIDLKQAEKTSEPPQNRTPPGGSCSLDVILSWLGLSSPLQLF